MFIIIRQKVTVFIKYTILISNNNYLNNCFEIIYLKEIINMIRFIYVITYFYTYVYTSIKYENYIYISLVYLKII